MSTGLASPRSEDLSHVRYQLRHDENRRTGKIQNYTVFVVITEFVLSCSETVNSCLGKSISICNFSAFLFFHILQFHIDD